MTQPRSSFLRAAGVFSRAALICLAGMLGAAGLVVLLALIAPRFVESGAFDRLSVVLAVVLQLALGYVAARGAVHRLGSARATSSAMAIAWLAPVTMAVLVHGGVAAEGEPLNALLPILGAACGAALGAASVSRGPFRRNA